MLNSLIEYFFCLIANCAIWIRKNAPLKERQTACDLAPGHISFEDFVSIRFWNSLDLVYEQGELSLFILLAVWIAEFFYLLVPLKHQHPHPFIIRYQRFFYFIPDSADDFYEVPGFLLEVVKKWRLNDRRQKELLAALQIFVLGQGAALKRNNFSNIAKKADFLQFFICLFLSNGVFFELNVQCALSEFK